MQALGPTRNACEPRGQMIFPTCIPRCMHVGSMHSSCAAAAAVSAGPAASTDIIASDSEPFVVML